MARKFKCTNPVCGWVGETNKQTCPDCDLVPRESRLEPIDDSEAGGTESPVDDTSSISEPGLPATVQSASEDSPAIEAVDVLAAETPGLPVIVRSEVEEVQPEAEQQPEADIDAPKNDDAAAAPPPPQPPEEPGPEPAPEDVPPPGGKAAGTSKTPIDKAKDDLEACSKNNVPTIMVMGYPTAGKTMFIEKLKYRLHWDKSYKADYAREHERIDPSQNIEVRFVENRHAEGDGRLDAEFALVDVPGEVFLNHICEEDKDLPFFRSNSKNNWAPVFGIALRSASALVVMLPLQELAFAKKIAKAVRKTGVLPWLATNYREDYNAPGAVQSLLQAFSHLDREHLHSRARQHMAIKAEHEHLEILEKVLEGKRNAPDGADPAELVLRMAAALSDSDKKTLLPVIQAMTRYVAADIELSAFVTHLSRLKRLVGNRDLPIYIALSRADEMQILIAPVVAEPSSQETDRGEADEAQESHKEREKKKRKAQRRADLKLLRHYLHDCPELEDVLKLARNGGADDLPLIKAGGHNLGGINFAATANKIARTFAFEDLTEPMPDYELDDHGVTEIMTWILGKIESRSQRTTENLFSQWADKVVGAFRNNRNGGPLRKKPPQSPPPDVRKPGFDALLGKFFTDLWALEFKLRGLAFGLTCLTALMLGFFQFSPDRLAKRWMPEASFVIPARFATIDTMPFACLAATPDAPVTSGDSASGDGSRRTAAKASSSSQSSSEGDAPTPGFTVDDCQSAFTVLEDKRVTFLKAKGWQGPDTTISNPPGDPPVLKTEPDETSWTKRYVCSLDPDVWTFQNRIALRSLIWNGDIKPCTGGRFWVMAEMTTHFGAVNGTIASLALVLVLVLIANIVIVAIIELFRAALAH